MKPRTMVSFSEHAWIAGSTAIQLKNPAGTNKIDEREIRVTRIEVLVSNESVPTAGEHVDALFMLVRGSNSGPSQTLAAWISEITGPDYKTLGYVSIGKEDDGLQNNRLLIAKPNFRVTENDYLHLVVCALPSTERTNDQFAIDGRFWYKYKASS